MKKRKTVIIVASLIVLLGMALLAYFFISPKTKIDGESTMSEAGELYVYDEDGNIETDPITGDNYVYQTDADGGLVYDEDGVVATQHEGYESNYLEDEVESTKFPAVTLDDPGETGDPGESGGSGESGDVDPTGGTKDSGQGSVDDPSETREIDPTAVTKEKENDPEASKAGGDVIGEITLPN